MIDFHCILNKKQPLDSHDVDMLLFWKERICHEMEGEGQNVMDLQTVSKIDRKIIGHLADQQ